MKCGSQLTASQMEIKRHLMEECQELEAACKVCQAQVKRKGQIEHPCCKVIPGFLDIY